MAAVHDVEKGGVEATTPSQALNRGRNGGVNNYAAPVSRIGNPGTLGLFSFASTTLILSLYNLQTRSITHANVVVGMAIFCGGLAQLLAGMWEFPRGNVFGATAFTSYGAFWMSYATILIPGSGVLAAFPTEADAPELHSALGIYLITWFMVTFFLLIAALRKNIAFITLFAFLAITFILLAAGEFTASAGATKAGGALGAITAMVAYYIGLSELLATEEMPIVRLPLGVFNRRLD
ncbi:Gpr1 family protein [Crucibulum laeve]|uniref:Gpr1 family protein n=1 Tax=Crucibulum laeve TaxID=68775 RepID=A0A5C3LN66_9AGAR|nr:Gpr1 family protein [Crucibulum laeve]